MAVGAADLGGRAAIPEAAQGQPGITGVLHRCDGSRCEIPAEATRVPRSAMRATSECAYERILHSMDTKKN